MDGYPARRVEVRVLVNGADITEKLRPYIVSVSYTDAKSEESDDLQITLQDRDGIWREAWLEDMIEASCGGRPMKLQCQIADINRRGQGQERMIQTGQCELDSVSASGPPSQIVLRATSLPFSSAVRQTGKNRAWEGYRLSGIAQEMATNAGMTLLYESQIDPVYERTEQFDASDIAFLRRLCADAGNAIKAADGAIVIYDQAQYEQSPAGVTIRYGAGDYSSYSLETSTAQTQYGSCRVRYTDPDTGAVIEGSYADPEADETAQQLEITAKVRSIAEAENLARKKLRYVNKFSVEGSFSMPFRADIASGMTISIEGFGSFDGVYLTEQVQHSVDRSGAKTELSVRRTLVY